MPLTEAVVSYIRQRVRGSDFRDWAVRLLCDLVSIDTAVTADVDRLRTNEQAILARIEEELRTFCGERMRIELAPIDLAIADDADFSRLYYTQRADRPDGLAVEECYRGRGNLVATLPGDMGPQEPVGGLPCVWNAHIDTVSPFYPCRVEDRAVHGRGAADDKASVAMLVGQVRLLEECRQRVGLRLAQPRAYQFVIDEEAGGNGSLSMARGRRFAGWQVIVGESTGNTPHPANRGCVWFRVEMDSGGDRRVNLVELAAHVVLGLEGLGWRLKAESDHPLFRPEHVQTCHGILGPHGVHPSAVSELVALTLTPLKPVSPGRLAALRRALGFGLSEYIARYGDKSKETDEQGNVKVPVHFELEEVPLVEGSPPVAGERGRNGAMSALLLKVHGKSGHMGAIHTLDCAIIKAAFLMAAVMHLNETAGGRSWQIGLAGVEQASRTLVLEGGQGFVPTHAMADVQARMRDAVERGANRYLESIGARPEDGHPGELVRTTFDKLHNAAFACPADMPGMQATEQAFRALGRDWPAPSGWAVSCDGRIFAARGHPTMVFGPGRLAEAHSANEFVEIDQVLDAMAISALAAIGLANGDFRKR